ncbi:hypothetical protein B0H10DRAFT_1827217, partial [Mycena sp. CBHHK59/15]
LSRIDFTPRDNLHFNEVIFATLAESNPGMDVYNAMSMGQVQHVWLMLSLATNLSVTNARKEIDMRTHESGLYLSVMGDLLMGITPKSMFVQIFFHEERLPIVEGWMQPATLITATTLNPIQNIIFAMSNWTQTQACEDLVLGPALTF